ncbi:MAG: glutamyl-tRNA reductase [Chitinophagaceae bacterium]|nr:glutamyl-tRNA reductase [Chitinophagaceae bacterium]
MPSANIIDIAHFFVVGINYKKTDAAIRGQFAINNDQYAEILTNAKTIGLHELFILSTCNRTEVYGFANNVGQLIHLLCASTQGDRETFEELAYSKNGQEAILHLFHVGAGLDSQILGDYEIVGQIKQASKFAKQYQCIGAFMERLVNAVLQSSKMIKNQTALSGGTVSVSFSAVQFIRRKVKRISGKKILLLGVGKIGRNTCKNLVDYLQAKHITLINRTEDKAIQLAGELGLKYAPVSELQQYIRESDIIFVATNSIEPAILASELENQGEKLIIDLSIPCNVEQTAALLPNITLVNVDELSKLKDETLQKRKAEIPAVKAIINEQLVEFMQWHHMRKHVPVLKAVKLKLQEIHTDPVYLERFYSVSLNNANHHHNIQKVLNGMAVKMRRQNQYGCYYIEAINEFLTTG